MDYKKMLEKVMKEIPKESSNKERFETPEITSSIQGNKTIIHNFSKVCDTINRKQEHIKKFLDRELATNGIIQDKYAVYIGRFRREMLNEKLKKYLNEFVLCKECGKPDTKIEKDGRISFIKCAACGAKRPIRTIK